MMREILRKIFQKNDNDHIVAELRVKQHVEEAFVPLGSTISAGVGM